MDGEEEKAVHGQRADESPEHGMKVLRGLNHLKMEKVLCDVALIAEGNDIAIILLVLIALPFSSKGRCHVLFFWPWNTHQEACSNSCLRAVDLSLSRQGKDLGFDRYISHERFRTCS